MIRNAGAISQALSPKISRRALPIWARLLARAPMMLTPTREMWAPSVRCNSSMVAALASEPAAENSTI